MLEVLFYRLYKEMPISDLVTVLKKKKRLQIKFLILNMYALLLLWMHAYPKKKRINKMTLCHENLDISLP